METTCNYTPPPQVGMKCTHVVEGGPVDLNLHTHKGETRNVPQLEIRNKSCTSSVEVVGGGVGLQARHQLEAANVHLS